MEAYQQLEQEFGKYIGNPNCVACSSGTAALHLALEALQLPSRGVCLVPEFTMVACPRAVVMADLLPSFVDCDDTLNLDIAQLAEKAHASDVWAIMPVHIYGRPCDMSPIAQLAEKTGLYVIEDMSEAQSVLPHPDTDAACWSFYRNKIIHGEEGGIVAFKNTIHADYARQLRSLGFTADHDFMHHPRGHNYRLANALAQLILPSLRNINQELQERRRIESFFVECTPDEWRMPLRRSPWVYDFRIRGLDPIEHNAIVTQARDTSISLLQNIRHGFKPMSMLPEFRHGYKHLKAYRMSHEVLYLPIWPDTNYHYIRDAMAELRSIVARVRGR